MKNVKKALPLVLMVFLVGGMIYAQSIKINSPAAGVTWLKAQENSILWSTFGRMNAKVKIRLYDAAGKKILNISNSTDNDCKYAVPAGFFNAVPAGKYRIRIKTLDNKVYHDSGIFNIAGSAKKMPPGITTLPPSWKTGRETIIKRKQHVIGLSKVKPYSPGLGAPHGALKPVASPVPYGSEASLNVSFRNAVQVTIKNMDNGNIIYDSPVKTPAESKFKVKAKVVKLSTKFEMKVIGKSKNFHLTYAWVQTIPVIHHFTIDLNIMKFSCSFSGINNGWVKKYNTRTGKWVQVKKCGTLNYSTIPSKPINCVFTLTKDPTKPKVRYRLSLLGTNGIVRSKEVIAWDYK